jgi:hypothetical protein
MAMVALLLKRAPDPEAIDGGNVATADYARKRLNDA